MACNCGGSAGNNRVIDIKDGKATVSYKNLLHQQLGFYISVLTLLVSLFMLIFKR